MNRIIKFRVWDTEKKRFITEPPENIVERKIELDFRTNFLVRWCGMELQQFTGLTDKNGKEIYEGDIVKIHNYKETWKHGEPRGDWRVFKIEWNRYLWSLQNEWISKPLADYDTTDLMPYDIEVIGNIYENPELLTH